MKKIYVSPIFDALYYSYYIQGLISLGHNVVFSMREFPDHKNSFLLFKFKEGQHIKKIVIDAMDSSKIDSDLLLWCDVYGKVNYLKSEIPCAKLEKVIPIGPSFGISVWNPISAWSIGINNFLISHQNITEIKSHFSGYRAQYKYRLNINQYINEEAYKNYVFCLNSIWKNDGKTNESRKTFISACKNLESIKFEGGFAPRRKGDVSGYEEYTIERRYSLIEYLEKTKKSLVVFNTPAVMQCLGWKLGEFLALGKAIISTPLHRELPMLLEHGKHIHYVDNDKDEIQRAVEMIASDPKYRIMLEKNARDYYEKYLCPESVIGRLIECVKDS